jgi:hypothetical protein
MLQVISSICRVAIHYLHWAFNFFAIIFLLLGTEVSAAEHHFVGVIVQTNPLELKSLEGEVRQFTSNAQLVGALKKGDLVKLTYESMLKDDRLQNIVKKDIAIVGATLDGTVQEIAADKTWLVVRTQAPEKRASEINVALQAPNQFQPLVSAMRSGDGISAIYTGTKNENNSAVNSIKALEWQSKEVGRTTRWLSLMGAALLLWLLAFIFTKGYPTELYLGQDNRYSSSKFQTVLWFWIVISAYLAIVYHRIDSAGWSYVGGVDIPPNLLILSGISVLTFATAKIITEGKVEKAAAKGDDWKSSAASPRAGDLIQDDLSRTDLGDFQMVVITIVAVIIYAITVVEFMEHIEFRRVVTMPDVDATLLAIFGLGQAAYLGKKVAGDSVTSDQAVSAAAGAANAAKDEASKALHAAQTAKVKEEEANASLKLASSASNKTAAETEAATAENAAKAAREASRLAATAARAAEEHSAQVKKLAETWSKDASASSSTKSAFEVAQAETAKALDAAKIADLSAKAAETYASNAKAAAAKQM